MNWLVAINDEGIQCKIPTGKGNLKKAAEEEKTLLNHAKIKFVFEFGDGGHDPNSKDYQDRQTFGNFLNVQRQHLSKKYGAASPAEFHGYELRKRYALGNGIEVMADLDADDYDEFQNKYSGIKGAIEILKSAVKIMSGSYDRGDPAKAIEKLIRKLEIEAE